MTTDHAADGDATTGERTDRPDSWVAASRGYAWLLLIAGAFALAAATQLTLDKIKILENPNYSPSCNINPIISCGSVMRTWQASAFGFPNSLIGLGAFAVVVTIGVVALTGARLPRWFWLGLQAGTLFGLGMICWLIGQTLYSIGAVCPYCMVVWVTTILLCWYTTVHNLRTGVIPSSDRARARLASAAGWYWLVPVACYLVIALLVLNRFWYYWSTLL
ncbi:vitamin K epoxide reductase family protein [Streptacidiphilus fuscans]|uniref:Vitamin K epoxide reductase family protein n=1 Tax=Streptacidiphilus fuscans TaxID=2789292 RepID=A0A931B1K7_9ACTN|nr:vitamin K epoxide reductase family protein [Streptacidiphilus fuscans]MBF9067246.1 vitamin K epoxide reductase family protein [Streptacidiphilus fuscans]